MATGQGFPDPIRALPCFGEKYPPPTGVETGMGIEINPHAGMGMGTGVNVHPVPVPGSSLWEIFGPHPHFSIPDWGKILIPVSF